MIFRNSIVWITGASSGIGKYLAIEFARQGARVALSARRMNELEKLALEINQSGGEAAAFYCDVLKDESIKACAAAVVEKWGRMDVAVANAGYGVVGAIEKLEAREWERQIGVNITGLALTAKYALPYLRQSSGRMVLVGSVSAWFAGPKVGAYSASKAAVHSIGQTLMIELKGSGVSCTTIHPGFVASDISRVDNEGVMHPERSDPRPAKLMWPTEKAAKVMLNAIYRRRGSFVFTGHGRIAVFIAKYFPGLARAIAAKGG